MSLIKGNEINRGMWVDLINHSKYASPFQTPDFFDFYSSISSIQTEVFAVEKNEKYFALILIVMQKEKGIKSFFSKRGIGYGGPLLLEEDQYLNELLDFVKRSLGNQLIYIEIRNYFDYNRYKKIYAESGFKYIPWLNFHLDTSNYDSMKSAISKSRKRQIRKAEKEGVIWKEPDSIEDVSSFYKILKDLYAHKIKKPLLPFEYFENFYRMDVGRFLLVFFNDQVIGGIMCPILEGKRIYEHYICGLDQDYKSQYPSIMATWAAMEFASQNNIAVFDFMGAGQPDEDYGVRDFKSRFGGKLVEHGRFLFIANHTLYKIGKIGMKVIQMIKS